MIINMYEHKAKKEMAAAMLKNRTDSGAVLDANWKSAAVYMFKDVARNARSPEFPDDLSTVDMDEFLGKVYVLAAQI